jgi:radical SAM family uncharacterized protein/radical SAM-linked protein
LTSGIHHRIEKELLPFVEKPGRYVGNELNVAKKDHSAKIKFALAFPDVYEIGMSYLGLAILYHIINKHPEALCERVFCPHPDCETILRDKGIPLFSLESRTPLSEFDIVGISLTYELNYTGALNLLDLSGIPLRASERDETDPLIIAGGASVANPEPMADFFDLFLIGDGEEGVTEIIETIKSAKENRLNRRETLLRLSQIEGVYVPSFYEAKYSEGSFQKATPVLPQVPEKVRFRTVPKLEREYYPEEPLLPFVEVVHDRLAIEIMRGCVRGCRFCQAGYSYRPKRERPVEDILSQARSGIQSCGYEELSLLSLSSTDYSGLEQLIERLIPLASSHGVSIALPSLPPGTLSPRLAESLAKGKKTGLTFAPEAGTERLRRAINKEVSEEDLLSSVEIAYRSGWNLVKLYFMIGLPTETEEDLAGIVELIRKVAECGRRFRGRNRLNVTISPFTPKPHTPFQWEAQDPVDRLEEKNSFLLNKLRRRNLEMKLRDPRISFLEGVLSRGDRRLSGVIEAAFRNGSRLDGWSEHFDYQHWGRAFEKLGIDPVTYVGSRSPEEPLPWQHLDNGVPVRFLRSEREKSREGTPLVTPRERTSSVVSEQTAVAAQMNTASSYGRSRKRRSVSYSQSVPRSLLRVKWSKGGEAKYTSHLENMRVFERAARRAEIPVAYSHGFHPHQKIAYGPPLTLGFTSRGEYFDIQLTAPYEPRILDELNQALPNGFSLEEFHLLWTKAESLNKVINAAGYQVKTSLPFEVARRRAESITKSESLKVKRTRKETTEEIEGRAFLFELQAEESENGALLNMTLAVGEAGYLKVQEVLLDGLGMSPQEVLLSEVCRTGLFVRRGQKFLTPFEVS